MAGKRGRPKKVQTPVQETPSVEAELSNQVEEPAFASAQWGETDRDKMYQKFYTDNPPEPAPVEAESEPTPEEVEESEATPEEVEEPVEEETPEQVVEEKEEKTVPLAALDEERYKRKNLQSKVDELEGQLNTVLQDYRKLVDTQPKEDDEELVNRKYVRTLENEVQTLKSELANMKRTGDVDRLEQLRQREEQLVNQTNSELEKEGFPGFKEFAPLVAAEKQKRLAMGESEASLGTPEGWKKLYRDAVFPRIRQTFSVQDKQDKFAKKEERKKDLKTPVVPGRKDTETKENKEWDYGDYLKYRQSGQVANF